MLTLVTDDVRRIPLVLENIIDLASGLFRQMSLMPHIESVYHEVRIVYGDYLFWKEILLGYQLIRINRW